MASESILVPIRIFNAFEQADGDISQRFGGMGLGLAIAAGLVPGHGGQLIASSEGRGLGATFTLRIPVDGPRGGAIGQP